MPVATHHFAPFASLPLGCVYGDEIEGSVLDFVFLLSSAYAQRVFFFFVKRKELCAMSIQTAASVVVAMLVLLARGSNAATLYTAPGLTDTLASSSQSYLIGVISFILFSTCIVMAVGSLMGIDYSGDSLLTVDVEPSAGGEE